MALRMNQESLPETAIATADAGATYTGTLSPAILGYVNGVIYPLSVVTTNSGANPTIALNSLSAITVKLDAGTALAASQMPIHGLYQFDGTNFILMNPVVSAATQAQMEAATSNVVTVTPGTAKWHPGMPKAWGYITPATTVSASYPGSGVSVVQNGTGDFTITHGVTFSSSAYAIVAQLHLTSSATSMRWSIKAQNATTFQLLTFDASNAAADPTQFSYVLFGDL